MIKQILIFGELYNLKNKMLYKDKNGLFWKKEDVEKLPETEVEELGLEETHYDESYMF